MTKTFTYFTDPGHGWIRVAPADCVDVGLSAESFSAYSYRDADYLYLEEDCDAAKFVFAFERKHGQRPTIKTSHSNFESRIRRKARCIERN